MSNDNLVVKTITKVKQSGRVFAGFNKMVLLVPSSNELGVEQRYLKFKSINELEEVFNNTSDVYKYAASFFNQLQSADEIYILAIDTNESMNDAINDFVSKGGGAYFMATTISDEARLKTIASEVELLDTRMMFVIASNSLDILNVNKDDDLASYLKSKDLKRTCIVYHDKSNEYASSTLLGRIYSTKEGESWENRVMKALTPSALNSTQMETLLNKNCGFFISIDGDTWSKNIVSTIGWYADITRGIDFIDKSVNVKIINMFKDSDIAKNNSSLTQIKGILSSTLDDGVKRFIVDEETIKLNIPLANQLANTRDIFLEDLYEFDYMHSMHKIKVTGSVTI